MARSLITPQAVTSAGTGPTYEAANAAGNSFRLAKGRLLHVKNGAGTPLTVTVQTPGSVDGLAIPDRTVTVPATSDRFIGLGTQAAYRQVGGVAYVDYSAVTTVTVAALDVP